jgi:hypothetical protein
MCNFTFLQTHVALLYAVVESSSCVYSIPLVILHLIGILYGPQKCIFFSQSAIDQESIKTVDLNHNITIQTSKSNNTSRGRVIHISLTKCEVKVLYKPISWPFCNRYKELLIFHSKRVVKVLHKSISMPAAKRVVKVLHKSISLSFSKKYQISAF